MKKIIIILKKLNKHIKAIFKEFVNDSCLVRASGLAYSTLLAMVPFITVIYAFGGFNTLGRSIESALLETLLPVYHETVTNALSIFTKNSLTTGAFGTIGFLLTTLFLLNTIARNFDAIWGIETESSIFGRYAAYTAILVFGSLLIGASNSITDTLERIISAGGITEIEGYKLFLSSLLPYFASIVFFYVLMVFIPSTKVKFIPALIGATISWVLFELSKFLFKLWVVSSVRNSIVYGSIAAIPIFLVGLYLVWLIILIGAEITFYVQNKDEMDGGHLNLSLEDRIGYTIDIFMIIGQSYREGLSINRDEVSRKLMASSKIVNTLINKMVEKNILIEQSTRDGGLIPGISMDNLYFKDLIFAICGSYTKYLKNGMGYKNSRMFYEAGIDAIDSRSIIQILGENNNEKSSKI